jgi:hypothetical protein
MKTNRPAVLSIAIILLTLASLWNLYATLLLNNGPDPAPPIVVYGSAVLGALGLVAAFGLWMLKRWGMLLAIIVSVLSGTGLGVGGIVYTASPGDTVIAVVLVALSILVIVLVVLPSARHAYAVKRVRVAQ